jgi:hypothetical protein
MFECQDLALEYPSGFSRIAKLEEPNRTLVIAHTEVLVSLARQFAPSPGQAIVGLGESDKDVKWHRGGLKVVENCG